MTKEEIVTAIENMDEGQLDEMSNSIQAMLAKDAGMSDEPAEEGCKKPCREGEEAVTPEEVETAEPVADELAAIMEAIQEQTENLEEVVAAIEGRRSALKDAAEKRQSMIARLKAGEGKVIRTFDEGETKMPEINMQLEYRNAWLNKVRGIEMTDVQKRAYSNTTNYGAEVVPIELQNEILTKVKTLAPMLGEITLLHAKNGVRYAVEGTTNDAAIHTENAEMSAAADTLAEVVLGAYEITKLVQISDTVRTMSIESFAAWITDRLAEVIARKLENCIINGDGSGEPTGIEKAQTWADNTNQITVAVDGSLSAANVQALIGLLNAGYDRNAKFVMSKRTLFTDFMPLQDKSKHDIVVNEGHNYYVYGYPVLLSDYVDYHKAYLGDFTKMVGNLSEEIAIHDFYDIRSNSYLYSGVAMFDCKPGIGEAIVKLNKASV